MAPGSTEEIVHLRESTRRSRPGDAQTLTAIRDSLFAIAKQLTDWGDLLSTLSFQIDQSTVTDIAAALDELERSLRELARWLSRSPSRYGEELKDGLQAALERWHASRSRESLTSYRQWREQQGVSIIETAAKMAQRHSAGKYLIEFAEDIRSALERAERAA